MNNKIKELIFSNEDYLLLYTNIVRHFNDVYFSTKTEQFNFTIDNKNYKFDFQVTNEKESALGIFVSDRLQKEDLLEYAKNVSPNILYIVKLDKKAKIIYPLQNIAMNERQKKSANLKIIEIYFDSTGEPNEIEWFMSLEEYHPCSFFYTPEERPKDEIIEFFSNSVEKTKINPLYQSKDESLLSFDLEITDKGTKSLVIFFDKVNDLKIKGILEDCFSAQESNISKHFYLITENIENLSLIQNILFKYLRKRDKTKTMLTRNEKTAADIVFITTTVDKLKKGMTQEFYYKFKEEIKEK